MGYPKKLLSLFDTTGNWAKPFAKAGWDVWHLDLQNWESFDINSIETAGDALEIFEDVDGILAAPPCTDFSVSGSQYWNRKDLCGQTAKSLELVYQVQKLANLFTPTDPDWNYDGEQTFFWVLENPVGRLPKLTDLAKPWYFQPWEFAGYTNPTKKELKELDLIRLKNGHNITPGEAELILKTNTYTKKTGLWGDFTVPKAKPIENVKGSPQGSVLQRYGGKSAETKFKRSATPLGFAEAFFQANKNHQPQDVEW